MSFQKFLFFLFIAVNSSSILLLINLLRYRHLKILLALRYTLSHLDSFRTSEIDELLELLGPPLFIRAGIIAYRQPLPVGNPGICHYPPIHYLLLMTLPLLQQHRGTCLPFLLRFFHGSFNPTYQLGGEEVALPLKEPLFHVLLLKLETLCLSSPAFLRLEQEEGRGVFQTLREKKLSLMNVSRVVGVSCEGGELPWVFVREGHRRVGLVCLHQGLRQGVTEATTLEGRARCFRHDLLIL